MSTAEHGPDTSAALSWIAAGIGLTALGGYFLLLLRGSGDGLILLAIVGMAVPLALLWSERRSRGHTRAVSLARQRLKGLAAAHELAVRNEQRFRALVLNASETITILDEEQLILYSSPSVERLWGYRSDAIEQTPFGELVHPDDLNRVQAFLSDLASTSGGHHRIEFRLQHGDGSWRTLESVTSNLLGNPDVGGIVLNSRDTTERKELEEQLTHQAFHDPLTGLPNRALFMDRLQHAIDGAKRIDGQVAVVSIDLDRFKDINDGRGHAVGDELLIAVSRVLAVGTRTSDTVARLGGDEFAMLLEGVYNEDQAAVVGERLIAAFDAALRVGDHDIQISLSIGIGLSGGPQRTPSELLRAADLALYEAKRTGRNRCVVFDSSLDALWAERVELENAMQGAVDRGEFTNFYQPLVDLHSGGIIGMEALVRWQHPVRGLVGPDVFVPLAEETGEIIAIGGWVLVEACRAARAWQALSGSGGIIISVNVSARQLQQPEFVDEVARALRNSGLEPGLLQLEITESLLVEWGQLTMQRLDELKRLGVRLAIDDFGTGYSSLSYLSHLPVDVLKLDRSFVSALGRDDRADSIVRAIIMLAHGLLIDVIAEGIETEEQQDLLRRFGYSRGQGFLFSVPVPLAEATALVRAGSVHLPAEGPTAIAA